MFDAVDRSTLSLLTAGGIQLIPADSGAGPVYRPMARGESGGRLAPPETLYDFFINAIFDPDQALQFNPNLVNEIHSHPDVAAAMLKRSLTVAQFEEAIEANPQAPNKDVAEEIATHVRRMWEAIPHRERLYQEMVYYATLGGGIGHDWVWHKEASGIQRPCEFWMVDKSRFVFDRQGNLALKTRSTPVWGTYVAADKVDQYLIKNSSIPRGRIVYHVFLRRPGQWEQPELEGYQYFGVGLDVPLAQVVTYGYFALRFWMRYIEKFGIPPMVLYHPTNMPLTAQVKAVAEQLRSESVTALPRTIGADKDGMWAVESLQVPTANFNWFKDFMEWIREKVYAICLFQADASGGGEQGAGQGYSSHVSKHDTGPSIAYKFDAKNVSNTLNSQLLPAITLQRFPNCPVEYWPVHKLQASEERDRAQEMDVAEKTSKLVPLAVDEVYERSGFRKPEPNEQTIGGPGQQVAGQPGAPGASGAQGAPKPGNLVNGTDKPATQAEGAAPDAPIGQGAGAGGGSVAVKPQRKQRTIDRMETSGAR